MKYLLDTHTLVWWDSDAARLSPKVFALFKNKSNPIFLSLASIWELQIKYQAGKLDLNRPLANIVEQQLSGNHIVLLPISLPHILALGELPNHHRDPFDRILIAQARVEGLTLITHDPTIAKYPVTTLW